jgi:hypothetical protein
MKPLYFKVLGVLVALILQVFAHAQVSVTTSRNNNQRTGQNIKETVLTPANVNVNQFGKRFSQSVSGYVHAQPLYLPNVTIPGKGTHNVVYVVTEHDSVYAFDADNNSGANASALWQTSFINPAQGITTVSSGDVGCTDLVPEIGITSTPVINPTTGTMYVVAKTKEHGAVVQRLHALDVTTGAEKFGGPVVIQASVQGNGDGSNNNLVTFDPLREHQRAGLLLMNGNVYISWASHCDNGPYHGWVMAYGGMTLKQTAVWNATPNGGLGGIWQSGTGVAGDSASVYVATGNGTFDADSGGTSYGDTIVKLSPPKSKVLKVVDYFTPFDQDNLNQSDADLGSGGVLLLPDQGVNAPHRRLLVEAGKEGTIYLVDRDQMGHFNSSNNGQIVQSLNTAVGGMWATPAWWNGRVYFGGSGDFLRLFTFTKSTGLLSPGSISESPTFFGFPGTTPSISANGTKNGIVWALQTDNFDSGPAILHAYDARDVSKELYNSGQNATRDGAGPAVKFTVPTVANGKVYVPAVNRLTVYGLLSGQ